MPRRGSSSISAECNLIRSRVAGLPDPAVATNRDRCTDCRWHWRPRAASQTKGRSNASRDPCDDPADISQKSSVAHPRRGLEQSPAPRPGQPVILRINGHHPGVSLETTPVPYLLARSKQAPAQMPSRPLPLVVHAGRPRLQDVLSAGASSLPPGAFGLVPPPHDDRWQASVPMTTTPNAILNIGNSRWAVSVHSRPEGLPGPHGVQCSPAPNPRRRLIVTRLMLI